MNHGHVKTVNSDKKQSQREILNMCTQGNMCDSSRIFSCNRGRQREGGLQGGLLIQQLFFLQNTNSLNLMKYVIQISRTTKFRFSFAYKVPSSKCAQTSGAMHSIALKVVTRALHGVVDVTLHVLWPKTFVICAFFVDKCEYEHHLEVRLLIRDLNLRQICDLETNYMTK